VNGWASLGEGGRMRFQIRVNPETLHRSDQGPITCQVWIEVSGTSFPEESWSDFAVVILGWWIEGALRLVLEDSQSESFPFMDGAFSFELARANGGQFRVRLGRRCVGPGVKGGKLRGVVERITEESVQAGVVVSDDLVRELLSSSNLLLRECRQRGWGGADIDVLAEAHRRLALAKREPE